ncbi:dimethylsulfoniopropionate lyase [Roseovarius pelagicus]|uniref:Dimethylsulfoniopropionate lyase n=1 Tax=Roseovarius pelagicus TaxID=2980108 RepID=A0ABY6D662_9RHOB|nr:dimethylsulfoniopropionate lyase [Roseovarius pelagicus]UXX81632.1 dimethylsulfoniopropionate lyase [Roseovarius pelagicus]
MRPDSLQDFLDATREAFTTHVSDPRAVASLARIFAALEAPGALSGAPGARLPACAHLTKAANPSKFSDPILRRFVEAFLRLEPDLQWRTRSGDVSTAGPDFANGHANAIIAGPGGAERRSDAWLGVSLVAPGVRYPDHTHPPEETYLVLSNGQFRQGTDDWFEPGIGGTLYNVPGIVHAMRAGSEPLFAFWALWAEPHQTKAGP